MRISDWSSDVCSSDLPARRRASQSAAESGLPRQLEPTPVDTVSPSRDRTTVTAARSVSVLSFGLAPSPKSPADALSAIVLTNVMSLPEILLSTIADPKSVVYGKSVSVSVDFGGRRHINKNNY